MDQLNQSQKSKKFGVIGFATMLVIYSFITVVLILEKTNWIAKLQYDIQGILMVLTLILPIFSLPVIILSIVSFFKKEPKILALTGLTLSFLLIYLALKYFYVVY